MKRPVTGSEDSMSQIRNSQTVHNSQNREEPENKIREQKQLLGSGSDEKFI